MSKIKRIQGLVRNGLYYLTEHAYDEVTMACQPSVLRNPCKRTGTADRFERSMVFQASGLAGGM